MAADDVRADRDAGGGDVTIRQTQAVSLIGDDRQRSRVRRSLGDPRAQALARLGEEIGYEQVVVGPGNLKTLALPIGGGQVDGGVHTKGGRLVLHMQPIAARLASEVDGQTPHAPIPAAHGGQHPAARRMHGSLGIAGGLSREDCHLHAQAAQCLGQLVRIGADAAWHGRVLAGNKHDMQRLGCVHECNSTPPVPSQMSSRDNSAL